ncbi:uncharacterized protein TM35_000171250 [Trypanosoma theileri]|uniref:Uncharacterized protein n=1 Tax=Trypanosoma theileri TaxID=67003 RepID=A0A1X0NUT9_9TRYP|nr:uncharacterized protein TM35_000171250 [Trypanosoma theileri]ORC88253.1 hypothetical protein TM35_000171250 [Trypanosoma theileri]
MELDLDAVSQALERLVAPSTSKNGSLLNSSSKTPLMSAQVDTEKTFTSTSLESNAKRKEAQKVSTTSKKTLDSTRNTQEILISPSKLRQERRPQQKRSTPFVPSPNQIPCRIVESSGLGASAILLKSTLAGKRQEEKVWSTNLSQTPQPYFVLNCLPKNYLRKEVISHVAPTIESTGTHVERIRDILLSIAFEPIYDGSEEVETPIERLVISCSNHPRTGYVSVLRAKGIEGRLMRAIIPGTLMGPFLKVVLIPKDAVRIKVVRVSTIEIAFADSWSERRIIEEALISSHDNDETEVSDYIKTLQNMSGEKVVDETYVNKNDAVEILKRGNNIGSSSSVNSSTHISTVGNPQEEEEEEAESVVDSSDIHRQPRYKKQENDAPVQTDIHQRRRKKSTTFGNTQISGKPIKDFNYENDLEGTILSSPKEKEPKYFTGSMCTVENDSSKTLKNSVDPVVHDSDAFCQERNISENNSTEGRISKALIAWSVKQRLLQDESVMHSLRDGSGSPYEARSSSFPLCDDIKESCSDKLPNIIQTKQKSIETLQARNVWDAVSHWSYHDVLLESMTNSSAFCVSIAHTSEEVLASLPQPYGLQLLFVLTNEVEGSVKTETDYFELMMMIARGERRRGYNAELLFRMTDGFVCKLYSRRDTDKEPQWLLVSVQSRSMAINECLSEALGVYEKIFQTRKKSQKHEFNDTTKKDSISNEELNLSLKLPVLRSVLDFACLFEDLLPVLRLWLSVGDMYYYGDVQSVFCPFINDCGIIQPSCWFHCILKGVVRSVLLSLPGAERQSTGYETLREMSPTKQRRLACTTLHKSIPFCGVWQSHVHAVRIVLSNAHALHHLDLLEGILMNQYDFAIAESLCPDSRSKFDLLKEDSTTEISSFSPNAKLTTPSKDSEKTSVMAFHTLSRALERSWSVVGIVLPTETHFSEDAFMDTVIRWAYAMPRVIVIFYCDNVSDESSPLFSAGFVDAFATVSDLRTALKL